MQELIIITQRTFDGLPHIVQTDDNKIYQLSYYDRGNNFRRYKEIIPKMHSGSQYYRIDGVRYGIEKLLYVSKRCIKRINLNKKVIKFK